MATVAERQAESERRRQEREAERERRRQEREAERHKKREEEQARQPPPDQVTVIGGDPNFQLGGGVFSILGIAENQALGGAQIISDQMQFGNRFIQQQAGGAVNQPAAQNNPPAAQNNPPAAQNNPPAAQNNPPAAQNNPAPQPGQENPAAEGEEPRDIQAATRDALEKELEDDAEVEVDAASKGGKSRHRNFVNFLATDEVPESIFGIPVVQDESQYTEKDIEFFRKNPKAAGFYDLGDEEMDEATPRQLAGGGVPVPIVPIEVRSQTVAPVSYGTREDGTFKGTGWDRLELPDGSFATEYSVGVNIDGREMLVPTIIPGMTQDDRLMMMNAIIGHKALPQEYMRRVVAHAKQRLASGQSSFKDDGLSEDDYRRLMGSKFRQFAFQPGHETFPGMFWRRREDGGRELMMKVNPQLDAWGYKRVPDQNAPGGWRQHENDVPIRFSSWAKAADMEDEITTKAVNTVLAGLEVEDPALRKTLGGFLWDVAFVKGGPGTPELFSARKSHGLDTRRKALLHSGIPNGIAAAAALLEQAPSYQKGNKNRARHRVERIVEGFAGREDLLGSLSQAYQAAVRTAKSTARTADDRKFEAHEAGMRAITNMLDRRQAEKPQEGAFD